jgi:hypothetical protein
MKCYGFLEGLRHGGEQRHLIRKTAWLDSDLHEALTPVGFCRIRDISLHFSTSAFPWQGDTGLPGFPGSVGPKGHKGEPVSILALGKRKK